MLWGGRFDKELISSALEFSSSLKFDINLILEDIDGSIAHAEMLSKVKIISKTDTSKIINGLKKIKSDWTNEKWTPDNKFEDIHSAIESRLFELIGETAGKLHTGRSRNDQIVVDIKLWLRKKTDEIIDLIKRFQSVLVKISSDNVNTIIPGYTHLQRAQPISLAFHLLAYVEMLERDKERFGFVKNTLVESPLGAGALAGSTLPLDRDFTSRKLGFEIPTGNSLDTVSNRDFILDFLNASSITMMHLSRLSEETILWSTAEWNFVKLSDQYSTGSSLMPQKKNPDLAELTRGKAGRTFGNYVSLITNLKSLPLSYNRDMQEDKEPLFDSYFTLTDSLRIFSDMLITAKFNKDRFIKELDGDFLLSTDLAEWLVLKGIPFRKAHEIVGKVVKELEKQKKNFSQVNLNYLKKFHSVFDETALDVFKIKESLKRKKTYGSPNPAIVGKRIKYWQKKLS
jgi:argininosuccinate lyase